MVENIISSIPTMIHGASRQLRIIKLVQQSIRLRPHIIKTF